ncbi:MAG: carboxypeptidase regulatory-like domain-containing protein [Nitrososphaerota archaeon]
MELVVDLAPITAAKVFGLGVGAAATISAKAIAIALGILMAWNVAAMMVSGTQQGDPYGVAYAAVVFYVVKDPSGRRHIVYYGQVPDLVWGTWPAEKSFKDIVGMVMSDYGRELGAHSVKGNVKTLPTKKDSIMVPTTELSQSVENWISDFVDNDVPKNISQMLAMPRDSLTLESVGVASIYIPYARTNFFDIFFGEATKTLDFSLTERVVRMSLQGVVGEIREITDPAEMVEMLGPVEVNGHIFDEWTTTSREARLAAGNLMIEGNPLKLEVKLRPQHRWPVYADASFKVTHWFIWDLMKGALSLPCPFIANGTSKLGTLFIPFSLGVNYVRGSSPNAPPSQISFMITGLDISKVESAISAYGSRYFQLQSTFSGVYITVSGSAFTWTEVGNETVDGVVWKLWRGFVKVEDFPILRYIAECGLSISVIPDVLPRDMKAVGGVIIINGGHTPTPTKAEFTFYATDSGIAAHVEASIGVYYDDPEGGRVWHFVEKVLDRWISRWPETYNGYPAYRHSVDVQEVTQKAYELSCRINRPVVIAAMAVIKEASPGTLIIQPNPARHFVYPDPEICRAQAYNLTVIVRDASTGQPIAGALVIVENKTLDFGITAATDSEGKARFTLSKGGYAVKAMKEGYLPSEPLPINLLADKVVEISLVPAELKLLTLKVIVYDAESGGRIAGASVTVRNATRSETRETDESGEAEFRLYAGGYDVIAWKEGYRYARKTISLQENSTVYMPLFKLMPNATVTVEVRDARNNQPIQGATVILENGTMVYTASTGSDGRAALVVPIGGYTMRVAASGYYPYTQTVYISGDREMRVALEPETMQVEPPIPPGGDSVVPTIIRVVDAVTGAGVAGAKVILARGPYVYESITDESGEAEFKISNGVYSFRVEHPGYLPTEGSMFMVKGSVYTIEVTPLSSVKSAKLTVYVLDSVTGNPVEGAKVTISNASSALVEHTDSQGRAEFILIAGGYSIRVEKEMYYPYVSEFRFPADRDAELRVSLDPYPSNTWIPPGSNYTVPAPQGYVWFVASIRFKDGAPFPGASVKIYNATTNELIGERVSDGEGWARFLLLHGKQYKVSIAASYRGQAFNREYAFTADASYVVMIYLPWYSNYSLPEVGVADVAFLNRIGLWGKEQVVVFNILSSVEQQVTVAVEAVNYTALLRGVEQVLASKTMTLNLSIGDNKQWASLKVDGSGWSLVAPRVRIISYQNDTSSENNERVGPAIQFGPLVDLRVTLYVFIAEYIVPARYPEITKYYTNLKIESGYDLPVPGTASMNYSWISAYTLGKEEKRISREAQVRAGVNWVNETFALPWTNVTAIEAFFMHPYEIIWADNYQVYYLELDEAVKILNVTHPWVVVAGSKFNVTVTVLSNKKMEHPMYANITYYVSENKFVILPFGISRWNITADAPQLPWWSPPQNLKMIVKVGADHYPDDNTYEAYITVSSQGWMTALIIGGVAIAGIVGIYAVYKSSKSAAQALFKPRRRAIRPTADA